MIKEDFVTMVAIYIKITVGNVLETGVGSRYLVELAGIQTSC